MHIVFVSREYPPSLRGGGISTYVKNVAEVLVASKQQVTVIRASDDTRLSNDENINNVRIISLSGGDFVIPEIEGSSLLKKFRGIYRFHSYRKKIRKTIEALKDANIIEVAEFGAEGLYLQDAKVPVVCRLHTPSLLNHLDFSKLGLSVTNWYYYFQGIKELSLLRKFQYITSCSASLVEWIEKYGGIDRHKIKVLYNPVNITAFPRDISTKIDSDKKILFAGTICDWKGVGDLFEAGKLLAAEGIVFRLEAAGKTGSYAEALKQQGVGYSWFDIIGKLPYEQLIQSYKEATVVCFPSWWEAMGVVCVEAMMCGAIVIGSSSGGMSEIITDGEDGFLLEPRNPLVWANKIKEVFALSAEERLRISQNAQKKIRGKFSTEVIIPQMLEYYEDVILKENSYANTESEY
jgi:glycosyltransferase involved in cell wall biosynthesis